MLFIYQSCKKDDPSDPLDGLSNTLVEYTDLVDTVIIQLNPNEITPLAALANIKTNRDCKVKFTILGEYSIEKEFETYDNDQDLSILGLYANKVNQIEIKITDENNNFAYDTIEIATDTLPNYFPDIQIDVVNSLQMEPGMHLAGLHLANYGSFKSMPIIFDNNGEIRWYIDLSAMERIAWPIKRLSNGNWFFGSNTVIYEFDMLGEEINQWELITYTVHHDIIELPDGNLIASVHKHGTTIIDGDGNEVQSVDDHIIAINRSSGAVYNEWDLREYLDVTRYDLVADSSDWFHMNAVHYSESDNCLIVSGRSQGVIKITWDNELVWILSPHKGWGKAGRDGQGSETTPFLLTAINSNGEVLNDNIQNGTEESDEFIWPWGQHAPMILPNGNYFLFDNGVARNFGNATSTFSSGIEYIIDDSEMTVEMVWEYGKDRGTELFSVIISDVDYLPQTGNRLITPGFIRNADEPAQAKIVEVTYPEKNVVFEATILVKDIFSSGIFGWGEIDIVYRSERLPIYPN